MGRYITVNRIEFIVTYLCNSRCRHCQLGEIETRKISPSRIDTGMAVSAIRRICTRFRPNSVMTFGGEPLLYPEAVFAIHNEARACGITSRELITNGCWSQDEKKILEISSNLTKSGVNEVHISVDCFHQEFIPIEIVKQTAKALLQSGIEHIYWNPCWVVSRDDWNPYNCRTKAILEQLKELPIESSEGNIVEPEGRAISELEGYFPRRIRTPEGKCGDRPYSEDLRTIGAISIEPDGRISICKGFHIGNAFEEDILSVLDSYDPRKIPEARALLENGARGLIEWARTKGIEPDPKGYFRICDLCLDIRRRATCQSC